jgi:uncharacterized protein YgbK (DUF1537 family)
MENHPLNPMTDADLRRVLAAQSAEPVGHVPGAVVDMGGDAIRAALASAAEAGQCLVIVDAIADRDLLAIGDAVAGAPLITGGSGIALGLARPFIARGEARGSESAFRPSPGPGAILAGSCSTATLRQIEVHRTAHPAFRIAAEDVFEGRLTPATVAAFVREHAGASPLAFSSVPRGELEALQKRYGREALAGRLEGFFADTARALLDGGLARLVIAGGETSGAVVSGLGIAALAVGPEIDPGVPALSTASGPPLALALKSGNFGAPDFFARALRILGGDP